MLRFQSLCGGSITAFSLYGHLFLSRLHNTQLQVNAVSITAELSSYLIIPLVGYVCDRYNPGFLSLISSFLFRAGYLLAAICYKKGPPVEVGGHGWPHLVMILAFIGIGIGTSCMYISAVTTCAKSFGRGKHKGLALGLPIAGFGVSSMWQSQFASRFLAEKGLDGGRGDIDVFKFFLFLSILLFTVGLIGALGLKIVDEEELIDEAVEELELCSFLHEFLLLLDDFGSPLLDFCSDNDFLQRFTGMDKAVDADGVIGHMLIDVAIHPCGRLTFEELFLV